jgi:hypothetical protein
VRRVPEFADDNRSSEIEENNHAVKISRVIPSRWYITRRNHSHFKFSGAAQMSKIYLPSNGPEGWQSLLAEPDKHW